MDKVLVEFTSPAAALTYDMYLPKSMRLGDVARLVQSVFSQLSGGQYQSSADTVVCDRDTGFVFDPNLRVGDSNIRNGSKLILF